LWPPSSSVGAPGVELVGVGVPLLLTREFCIGVAIPIIMANKIDKNMKKNLKRCLIPGPFEPLELLAEVLSGAAYWEGK